VSEHGFFHDLPNRNKNPAAAFRKKSQAGKWFVPGVPLPGKSPAIRVPEPSANLSTAPPTWEDWLRSHADVFLLYARHQTRSEEDARDVLQEALVESWQRSDGRVPDKALVLATIHRRAIDLGRSRDRRSRREEVVADRGPRWFCQDFTRGDTEAFLAEAVQALPEHLRETVLLRVWGELGFPEIARVTGAPVATVTSRYRYALERLRTSVVELKP
jgi:RNA polymerase sigma factor (sigma-70 family)